MLTTSRFHGNILSNVTWSKAMYNTYANVTARENTSRAEALWNLTLGPMSYNGQIMCRPKYLYCNQS